MARAGADMYQDKSKRRGLRLSGFDYFVLAGAAVNLAVVLLLTGYWLFSG